MARNIYCRSVISPWMNSRRWAGRSVGSCCHAPPAKRSEEHTSELQSLMRISYAVFCLNKKRNPPTERTYVTANYLPNKHTLCINTAHKKFNIVKLDLTTLPPKKHQLTLR